MNNKMNNPTARIRPSKDGKGLWLFIDEPNLSKAAVEDVEMFNHIKDFPDVKSKVGGVAYPLMPEEVEAIRDACNEWLELASNSKESDGK